MSTDYCFYHPYTKSIGSCERCSRPLCSECLYTFTNPPLWTYAIQGGKENEVEQDIDNLYLDLEELSWCYPCYYDHFGPIMRKNTNIFFIFLIYAFASILFSIGMLIFAYSLTSDPPYLKISNNMYSMIFVVSFTFLFFPGFFNEKKKDRTKSNELSEMEESLSSKIQLNYPEDSFPIECYYCKEKIRPDFLTCLNLYCTLGEKVEESSQIMAKEN